MATTKITTKPVASELKQDAYLLATQEETVAGEKVPALRRITVKMLMEALKVAGINGGVVTETALNQMYSQMVQNVEAIETGIRVTFWDNTSQDIEIQSGGLAFDEAWYDQENGYLHIRQQGVDVIDPCFIGGGGGGSSSSGTVVKLENLTGAAQLTVAHGERVQLSFSFYDYDGDETTNSSGTMNVYVNNILVISKSIEQGNTVIDVGDLLAEGTNKIRIRVTNEDENYASKTWTVNAVALSISAPSFVPTAINSGEILFRYTPIGNNIDKAIHFEIDGREVATAHVTASNRQQIQAIPAQPHGAHKFRVWATATVDGVSVTSNILVYDIIWADDGNDTPVIACSFEGAGRQYSAVSIPYQVYNPASLTAAVELAVNGVVVNNLTVDRNLQTWTYRPTETGLHVLTIKCGTTVKTINLQVSGSGVTVQPITTGLVLDLDPTGHTNNDTNRTQFGYTDAEGKNHKLTFSSNFDWRNGGFQVDEKGNTYLCVKCGTTVTLDRSLFEDDAAVTGKEIKIIFRATNCRNYDAQILSCLGDGIGLVLNAQSATVKSELTTQNVQYCEDSLIEMDVNIESDAENRAMMTWLEGIPSKVDIYAQGDNWKQSAEGKQNVVIGSNDCDVHIYRIKQYATSLTRTEIHENWIADAPDAEEMFERWSRNDVYDQNGNISVAKLIQAAPNLHVIELSGPKMTTSKKDPVYGSIRHTYRAGGAEKTFTASNVIYKVQGTSSAGYGAAAFNLDLDFKEAQDWQNGNGDPMTGWQFNENSIPIKYINLKVNVASSENANNVVLQGEYNDFQPYINPARQADPRVRDTMYGEPCVIFFTNTSNDTITVSSRTLEPGETMFYAVGDMMNSKKNTAVFGQGDDNPNQCCIEISNNTNAQCLFQSDDISEPWDGDHSFEFRHVASGSTETLMAAWKRVLSWVISTDRTKPTNGNLPQAVKYGNETFVRDTAEYRAAKFVAEYEDYFIKDSLLYHYLFTERHMMVDNRAKNVFVSTDDGVHWDFTKDYDNDTADGNDNEGGLTLSYGLEDCDQIGTKDVFNAASSVLWINVRDLLHTELAAMFIDRERAGAWDSDRILARYDAHQSARPEAIVIEDMWQKYISPFVNLQDDSYLDMMLGTKNDQRRQFEKYQEKYCSSKYRGLKCVSTSETITFRGYTPTQWGGIAPGKKITLTPYADMYINVTAGSGLINQRAKRGIPVELELPIDALNDTEIYIYSASNIQDLGDLAPLYIGYFNVSTAVKLRNLKLGDGTPGYSNTNSGSITVGANTLLENLDIRNCPNIAQALDLSGCTALTTLEATGSGITGVTFAKGGNIRTARLPAVNAISAVDLSMLVTLSVASWNNLQTFHVENCPAINTLQIVKTATGIKRLRLTGINWSLENTDLLDRLLKVAGLDEANHNTDVSVLTGTVTVPIMRQLLMEAYNAAWSDLILKYSTLVPQYTVIFRNWNGTVLDTQYIDRGESAVDPIVSGKITTPTRSSTISTVYTFKGWDSALTNVTGARTITAMYTETPRKYRVRWYNGGTLLQTAQVNYGEEAIYTGQTPTYTLEEGMNNYVLFDGWSQSTGRVTSNIDVQAHFQRAELNEGIADPSQVNAAYLYGTRQTGQAQQRFGIKDRIPVKMGYEPLYGKDPFTNPEGNVNFVDVAHEVVCDGSTIIDTQVKLLENGVDDPWTVVIDFEFSATTNEAVIASLWEDNGFMGFKIKYSNSGPTVVWGTNSYQSKQGTNREIMVIRHEAGSRSVFVYSSNTGDNNIALTEITKSIDSQTNHTLIIGCDRTDAGSLTNFATGVVHSCRVWYDDLGNTECQKLVRWPREELFFEVAGFSTFKVSGEEDKYTSLDLICASQLSRQHRMKAVNDNSGGYITTEMHPWLEGRVFKGMPDVWQPLIQQVRVPFVNRINSTTGEILYVDAHLFLPAYNEVNSTSTEPWIYEGVAIPFFTNNTDRIKFRGLTRPEGQQIFTQNTDPSLLASNNVAEGDMWVDTGNGSIGKLRVNGAWVSATHYWLRGASLSYAGSFCYVGTSGNAGTSGAGATGVNGVVPRFSI